MATNTRYVPRIEDVQYAPHYDTVDLTIENAANQVQVRIHGTRSIKGVINMTSDEAETFALQLIRNAHEARQQTQRIAADRKAQLAEIKSQLKRSHAPDGASLEAR